MSDNNVCQYCNGYETTTGFVHEARCPMNRTNTTYNVPLVEDQAEIARLKHWLENADKTINRLKDAGRQHDAEIARLKAALERSESAFRGMVEIKDEIAAERDDARKWARKFYRAYLDLAVGYDNSWDV